MEVRPVTHEAEIEAFHDRRRRHWFDRLVTLSDAVFAFAATLIAADFHPPEHWSKIADILPVIAERLDTYGLSFLVIGVYWLAHRRLFAMIREADAPVAVLNLIMLALVALLPSATQLIRTDGPQREAMALYAVLVVSIGVALTAIWGYAALIKDLVATSVPRRSRWFIFWLNLLTPPLFLAASQILPYQYYGVAPMGLAALFLIGWRARVVVFERHLKLDREGAGLHRRPAEVVAPKPDGARRED